MWKPLTGRRPTSIDALFAIALTALVAGLAAAVLGVVFAESGALPGIGIVGVVVGGYTATMLRPRGETGVDRSMLRSFGRGYRHLWHWVRPAQSPRG